ncbi:hypothetical protein EVAR_7047_1 [Eumeta japonica]|uniref:Transmembrane protein n=1 Tax=Eumeta variegata TaxID=151549 RepID=A0A4C1YR50_EUMVA|nr:hypothetical protein EVAR_7047_1 [Eumeta japonica]
MYPTTSSERTPLVQPAYVYESSLSRNYRRRLRNLQCAICVTFIAILTVALLVTVSYNLNQYDTDVDNSTNTGAGGNLTLLPPDMVPLQQLTWPLPDQPPAEWIESMPPSPEAISAAVGSGNAALTAKKRVEATRGSLAPDTPAGRAQRAAATAASVAPLADAAYAAEYATRALLNGEEERGISLIYRVREWNQN